MPTHTHAEHDPQHQQRVETPQYEAPTYEELGVQSYEQNTEQVPEVAKDKPPKIDIYTYRPATYMFMQTRLDHNPAGTPTKETLLVSGMNKLGESINVYKGTGGGSYTKKRYLLTGTVAQWTKLLSDVNSHYDFDTYVTPFLAEAGAHDHTIDKTDPNQNLITQYSKHYGKINDQDILNFTMALYGYDAAKETSTLDFPNTGWDSDSNTEFANKYSQALNGFITLYQPRLVKHISEQNSFIEYADAQKLAEQGSPDLQAAKIMVQSAISSAFMGAARVFNAELTYREVKIDEEKNQKPNNKQKEKAAEIDDPEKERKIGSEMVFNSGRIIKGALAHQARAIAGLDLGIVSFINAAWSLAPLPKLPKAGADFIKNQNIQYLPARLKIGHRTNIEQYKDNLRDAFAKALGEAFDQKGLITVLDKHAKDQGVEYFFAEVDAEWYNDLTQNFLNGMK
mgnify:CR=1 FL=1